MAHLGSRRKRRLAQLTVAALIAAALSSCASPGSPGWFVSGDGEPIQDLAVRPGAGELLVTVELPPGYEAAEEFTQRATLSAGESIATDTQHALARPFRLAVPTHGGEDARLELMIGFCRSDVKEICYLDTPTLRLSVGTPPSPRDASLDLVYRPEEPR